MIHCAVNTVGIIIALSYFILICSMRTRTQKFMVLSGTPPLLDTLYCVLKKCVKSN